MRIHVGNLSYSITEDDIRAEFAAFGEVTEVRIIKDKFTKKPKGFAFVEMPNDDQAQTAIDTINGKELKGRAVRTGKALERREGGEGDGGGYRGGGGGDRGGYRGGSGGGDRGGDRGGYSGGGGGNRGGGGGFRRGGGDRGGNGGGGRSSY